MPELRHITAALAEDNFNECTQLPYVLEAFWELLTARWVDSHVHRREVGSRLAGIETIVFQIL